MKQRWVTLLAVIGVIGAVAWGFGQRGTVTRTQAALEAGYQRDFFDLMNQVEQLQVVTGKALVSASKRHNISQLTEIWMRANTAQADLSRLPLKDVNLSASRKFLSQMGDYAFRLAQANARGDALTPAQVERLAAFERQTARLSSDLHTVQRRIAEAGFRWSRVPPNSPGRSERSAPKAPDGTVRASADPLGDLTAADKRLQQLPALIYDGPFSDHLEQRRPRGLTGPSVSQDRAVAIARAALDNRGPVTITGRPRLTRGRLPVFAVTFREGNDRAPVTVDVSRQGGHVIQINDARPVRDTRLSSKEARARAAAFLERHGFSGMEPTFTTRVNHTEVIAFVYRQGDVLLYPDQVKVKVALDNGQVIGLDAVGYFTNHRPRRLPAPGITPREARDRVSPRLRVEGVRLTLIPTDSGREILAYEVRGRRGRDTYLVYLNALTGNEENILKVVDTPQGKMVM